MEKKPSEVGFWISLFYFEKQQTKWKILKLCRFANFGPNDSEKRAFESWDCEVLKFKHFINSIPRNNFGLTQNNSEKNTQEKKFYIFHLILFKKLKVIVSMSSVSHL